MTHPITRHASPIKHTTLLALLALATATTPGTSPAEQLTLTAFSQLDRQGDSSQQPLDALAEQDQTGEDDEWDRYREFYPGDKGYRGIFKLDLPEGYDIDSASSLQLQLNYRGPTRAEQRWRWQLRDYAAGRWVAIGDNADAGDWYWSALNFSVPGDPGDYLDDNGRFKLRYSSNNDRDASQIDYLALNLQLDDTTSSEPPAAASVWQPAPGTSWQWQLSGSIDTSHNVAMYDIDLFDAPQAAIEQLHADGRVVICYFSAGSWEDWRSDAAAFPAATLGRDNGWPGERWLDIRQLDQLAPIMLQRLDLAVSKGCDGVEPDNVDGYVNNSGFPLSGNDQLKYNRWLAEQAHSRSLSVGLKNDLNQVEALQPWFDWALNEECLQFQECELLLPFVHANKAVFGVEYQGNPASYCPQANVLNYDWLVKDLELGAAMTSCREYP